ncbi:MAG: MscL family protein [Candidatus Kerfeldbacteria bacterium]|nr:MscL family protein [Candidatus Kerfeldbacteria bacterium]
MSDNSTTNPAPLQPRPSFWQSFREFLKQYSVIGLAIGVVMGTAVNRIVQAFVEGFITPLIGLVLPDKSLQQLVITVRGSEFKIGDIINALLNFVVVALIIYITVKKLLKQDELLQKK